jgi:phosphoribosylanthranilate isomerase
MLHREMAVKVKICGITNEADALAAVAAGADALGFVFYSPSPRSITIERAAAIVPALPPFVVRVGVFVNASEELVTTAVGACSLSLLQFHGEETPEYCQQFGLMSMKAFRVQDENSLQVLPTYPTDAWLLDAYSPDAVGGTGRTFNWELAVQAQKLGRPIFLAGGLTPANVGEAVRRVQPYGVDVSSGVEKEPGQKDHAKVTAFIKAAKAAGE